jgi:hypothetical protein
VRPDDSRVTDVIDTLPQRARLGEPSNPRDSFSGPERRKLVVGKT